MGPSDQNTTEQERIRAVYQTWLAAERISAYAWHRPDVMEQAAARHRVAGQMLARALGLDLSGVRWHLGDLDFAADASFELAVANTVFSSILDPAARAALAAEMWRTTMPGGWCMVFDFRYNNPRNDQVRRVTRAELASFWPGQDSMYQSLLLAPPIARRLSRAPRLVGELLVSVAPLLRSHFIYMTRKPG